MLVILAYHDITHSPDPYTYSITPQEFKRQISYLNTRFRIISLDRAQELIRERGSLIQKEKLAAITFDDALAGAYRNGFPFLIEQDIPFTVFVPTGLLGARIETSGGDREVASLEEMSDIVGLGSVSVESHGRSHTDFVDVSMDELKGELIDSKNFLQEHGLNDAPSMLAYPHGKSTQRIREITAQHYSCAFGSGGVLHSPDTADLMNLPRITISDEMSFLKYKITLSRPFWWLKNLKRSFF